MNDDLIVTAHHPDVLATETTTGSRLGLTPLETPASLSTIDGDELRARGDMTVTDAVTRAPGITTAANPGNGGTALAARGFNGQGSILQLYDGIRLYPVAGTITFPVDPWTVDHIEVLSGPASVLYGQGALGGAINVITRKAQADRSEYQAEAGFGSQATAHLAAGAGGPIVPGWSYRADASYRRSDGYVDRGGSHSLALSGELRFAPTADFSLALRDDYGDQRPTRYFGTPLIDGQLDDANRHRNYNVTDAEIHYRDNRTTAVATWTPAEGIEVSDTAYRLTSKRLFKDLESYFYDEATHLVDRVDNIGIVHDQTQYGNEGSVRLSLPLGTIKNDLVVGFDVNVIRLIYSNDFGSDPQDSPVDPFSFSPGVLFDTQGIAPRFRTHTVEYSFFAEDRVKLNDRLSLVFGLRHENDSVSRSNIDPAGKTTPVFDKDLEDTTWRVGAVYQPLPGVSLYGQYSTGVDPIGTLTTFSSNQTSFKNATGDQVEAGAKYSFLDGHGSATFAAYRIVKKNLLISNPADLRDTTPLQVGQRSAKGLEASLAFDLPWGFGIDANGTVLKARYDSFNSGGVSYDGMTPPNIPETAANAWLRWSGLPRFEARAGLRYVGKTYSDNANSFRIPAYTVVDASLSYAVIRNVAVDLRLYNLFDKDYATTSYNDQQWLLGRPRSVDVSISARY